MSQHEAGGRTSKRLRFILRWTFAATLLALLFHKVPLSEVLDALLGADVPLLLLASGAAFCTQLVSAKRLKLLSDETGLGLTTYELLRINLATMFYGLFLPAGSVAGFAIRVYRVSQPKKQYVGSMVSILFDRVVATVALCIIGIVAWLFVAPRETWPVCLLMTIAFAGISFLQAMFFIDWRVLLPRSLVRWLARITPPQLQPSPSTMAQFRAIRCRTFVQVFALSILAQLLGIVAYQLISVSLGIPVMILTIAWVRSAAMLASLLPVSVAGLGVRDATLLALLVPLGVADTQAIAFSMLVFGVTILAVGLTGGALEVVASPRETDASM